MSPIGQKNLHELAYWGLRFREVHGDHETAWKLKGYARLAAARQAMLDGDPDWPKRVISALQSPPGHKDGGLGTVVAWQMINRFKHWMEAEPAAASGLMHALWDPSAAWPASLRQPLQTLASVNKGPGTRLSLVTVLAGAVDPHTRVPYKAHAFGEAYRLTGYSVVPAGLELLADYEHALGFLDALGSASRFLGEPVSRLEAHDLMWYVLRYTAPETWSADDVSALHRFLRRSETSTSLAERAELELDAIAEQEAEEDAPADDDEARRRVLRAIWERRGQPKFRQEVGDAYGGRCAITNCDCSEALEAAHIRAMADEGANAVSNGILLRGDVHTLFDRGLLAIDVSTWKVVLAPALRTGSYSDLHGAAFRRPEADALAPAEDALRAHRKACGF